MEKKPSLILSVAADPAVFGWDRVGSFLFRKRSGISKACLVGGLVEAAHFEYQGAKNTLSVYQTRGKRFTYVGRNIGGLWGSEPYHHFYIEGKALRKS